MVLRLRGEGDVGSPREQAGDLDVVVKIRSDGRFRRKGDDIYSDWTVSGTFARGCGTGTIETLWGRKDVELPPGTTTGTVIGLKGLGMPALRGSGKGYHLVKVSVE